MHVYTSATFTITDGTNTETLLTFLLTNEAVRLTHAVQGRMQGWADGIVKYTVAGANPSQYYTDEEVRKVYKMADTLVWILMAFGVKLGLSQIFMIKVAANPGKRSKG